MRRFTVLVTRPGVPNELHDLTAPSLDAARTAAAAFLAHDRDVYVSQWGHVDQFRVYPVKP